MNRTITLLAAVSCCCLSLATKHIEVPQNLKKAHPRLTVASLNEEQTKQLREKVAPYIDKVKAQPDWLVSRLQMNWATCATDVFINGEKFDHVGGDRAPEPTVKYNGTRGNTGTHNRPKLADVVPYDDDDASNVTFRNMATSGQPMEKVHPSKTGTAIASINREIMGIAHKAAHLYHLTGSEQYAAMAAAVMDCYLAGIYYRNVPIDLNHGHQQTLVGMSSFEVIHDDIIDELVPTYDFLYDYLQRTRPQSRMDMYSAALKKWADNLIANGVPHNNWNLFQAMFIIKIALVLNDDSDYADHRGRHYYIDYILNRSSIRQWSLQRLAEYGFDEATGIWAESPGYSSNVVCDYLDVAQLLRQTTGIDLIAEMPVLKTAVAAMPQYLFPNGIICGFGDTHPARLRTTGLQRIIEYARETGRKADEAYFTQLLNSVETNRHLERYVSPTFYAAGNSWLAQRNGMNREQSLMMVLNGSKGNHQHANGISMELYGRGYTLGVDGGIGKQLYSGLDYSEYYSQFPAHNTVCVDGVSSYPVMMSQHAFQLRSCFPLPQTTQQTSAANAQEKFSPLSYAEVYFREPETQADQVRTTGIVSDEQGGYYIDIFRSRRTDGQDKMHDYFYHNLGQELTLTCADGSSLDLQPTEELAFAGGHLYAYSYIYNKVSSRTKKDIKATFTTRCPDGNKIEMNLWMRGSENREVFKALSPENMEYERLDSMPYTIKGAPVNTFIAQQSGEAWNHPFVAVFEPTSTALPSTIRRVSFFQAESNDAEALKSFAGIKIERTNDKTDYVFSAYNPQQPMQFGGMSVQASYAVISDQQVLIGNGTYLSANGITRHWTKPTSVLLIKKGGKWEEKAME